MEGLGGALAKTGVSVVLDSDPAGIISGFAQADTAGKKFAATLGAISNVGKATFNGLQRVATGFEQTARRIRNAGIGLGVSLLGATYGAVQLDAAMHNVATIDENVRKNFEKSIDTAISMSRVLPASAKDITEAWYEIASSGFYGAQGTMVLTQAVKAGTAGLASTAEAGMALTAVLNAYGLSASKARTISDLMFQTVNLGVLHFGDLAGVVGDSVGLAAAAGVSFKEVGAAIATMTLNGISASEAGTSLNRLIQQLIQPSEGLAFAWSRLSMESLTMALRTQGLHAVMEQLRVASGGNVEILKSWFDEIRAARGAFALMGAEGSTYTRVLKGMDEATQGSGATQRAFNEQMKSTSMQFKLMMNDFKAIGLEIGDALQPIADAAIRTARIFLGAWAEIPRPLKELIAYVSAFGSVLMTVGGIIGIFAAKAAVMALVTGLLSKALIALGSSAIMQSAGFTRLGTVLTATGQRVQGMTLSMGIMSTFTSPLRFLANGFEFLGRNIAAAHPMLANFGLGLQRMGSFLRIAATNVMMLARTLPILAVGLLAVLGDMNRSNQAAEAWVQNVTTKINADTFSGLSKGLAKLRGMTADSREEMKKWSTDINLFAFSTDKANENLRTMGTGLRGVGSALTSMVGLGHVFGDPFGDATKFAKASEAANKYQTKLAGLAHTANRLLAIQLFTDPKFATEYANASSIQRMNMFEGRINLVAKAAKNLGISTADMYDLGKNKILAIAKEVDRLGGKAGMTGAEMSQFGADAVKAFQEQQKAIQKFVQTADQAFMKGFDIAGAVTEQGAAGQKQLREFLFGFNNLTQEFVDDMDRLMRKGLDPEILSQFAAAGPEASRNAIKAMLDDSSGQLIQFANDTVAHLRDLRVRLAQEANLISRAALNPNIAGDLVSALDIGNIAQQLGVRNTPEKVAYILGLDPVSVTRIATEFGIPLGIGMEDSAKTMLTNFEALFGPGLKDKVDKAANGAQISDFQAGKVFETLVTKGKDAATTLVEQMGLVPEKKQILLDLIGWLEALGGLNTVGTKADDVGKKNPKVKVGADTSEADYKLQSVEASMARINGLKAYLGIEVAISNAAIIAEHPEIFGFLAQRGAKGMLLNGKGMQTFARGGETHNAQIANGGAWRLWAEPETGGEAYIPLHNGRPTARALYILDHVAEMFGYAMLNKRRMGMANGGLISGSNSRGSVGSPVVIHSEVTFSGDVAGHEEFKRIAQDVLDRRDRALSIALTRKG